MSCEVQSMVPKVEKYHIYAPNAKYPYLQLCTDVHGYAKYLLCAFCLPSLRSCCPSKLFLLGPHIIVLLCPGAI